MNETTKQTRSEQDVVYSQDGQSCRCIHCGQPAIVLNGVAECINGQDCIDQYGIVVSKTERRAGKWKIEYEGIDPQRPYSGVHDDFDGAPTYSDGPVSDRRCLRGSSIEDVLDQIAELELEEGE